MVFNFEYVTSKYGKIAISVLVVVIVLWLFFKDKGHVSNPRVSGIALPGSHVHIDQQAVVDGEKPFEVGLGGLCGRYDSKDLYGVMVTFKYKF